MSDILFFKQEDAMRLVCMLSLLVMSVAHASAQTQGVSTQQAEGLYKERCANCHDRGVPRAANREALGRLSPDAIRQALMTGAMRTQAEGLTAPQVEALTRLLAGAASATTASADNKCPAG
jgi:polyvinyl alcohol dehydrogenase (cytochrome)